MTKHICIVAGSNGKNLILAKAFQDHLEGLGHKVSLINVVEAHLPLYSPAQEGKIHGADVMAPFKDALSAHHFVFVAPEYNGAPPPALINFIAWASRSAKDWRNHFNTKRAAIATYSGGDGGQALSMMRLQLSFIGMTVIGRQINVNDRKAIDPASLEDVCKQLLG